jgi:large subunit ribosomal protein L17
MRHRKDGRQFGRNTPHRRAMFRNLAANLITHERIVTTEAKAKELRRVTDRLITKAKRLGEVAYTPQDKLSAEDKAKRLHIKRLLGSFLPRFGVDADGDTNDLIEKVMIELSQRFKERTGGYTRIIKLGARKGDGAQMSVIELVGAPAIEAADDPDAPDALEAAAPAAEEPAADAEDKSADDAEDEEE